MGKRFTVFLAVLMMSMVFGGVAEAHSSMVSSDPEAGSTAEGEVSTLTMTFDTDIQQEEEIYLENTEGERIDYEDITVEGETVEVSFSEPLVSGDYTVVWELYGADGHVVNGDFEFTVAGAESGGSEEATEEATEEPTAEESEAASEEETGESEGLATEDAAVDDEGGMSGAVVALIVVLGVIVAVMIVLFARRRK
ncbi:copper resistance protein CopC [Salinicoccus sp. HZC-1]|uniref:copper resistance CopC family protein n=1 Tax=Salinicoccus sp. HZC-1 TaxID=3385497 RepID=UPI00398AB2DB